MDNESLEAYPERILDNNKKKWPLGEKLHFLGLSQVVKRVKLPAFLSD
jgi:hypothetical protein